MIYLAYFILAFAFLQLIISTLNIIFIQSFRNLSTNNKLVSVLIPARNEEKNIENILNDLIQQPYKNIEIIVFNDQSIDKTQKIVEKMAIRDNRINILNSEHLPHDWLGKNYACYKMSEQAKGDYFLFIDADVRIKNQIIPKSLNYLENHNLKLLSIFPHQKMFNFGEKITVPLMNYILLTLLPLILVRISKFNSLAAANGQFMLFEAETYKKLNPHFKMKQKKVEDIEIARYYKQKSMNIACLVGKSDVQCRMYTSFNEATNGFSKNISSFFGNSLLIAFFFWFLTTFGFLFILISMPIYFFFMYVTIVVLTKIFVSFASNQNIIENIIYLPINQIVIGIIIYKSAVNKMKKNFEWKGRKIS